MEVQDNFGYDEGQEIYKFTLRLFRSGTKEYFWIQNLLEDGFTFSENTLVYDLMNQFYHDTRDEEVD